MTKKHYKKIYNNLKIHFLYFNVFKELSETRDIVENCYYRWSCKPILISGFSFLKIAKEITPPKKNYPCKNVTSFYPLCKDRNYSEDENPNRLQLAQNYAKDPLTYYKDIRYKSTAPKIFPEIEIAPPTIPSGEWSFNDALIYMEYNPQKAYNTLKKAQTLTEKLQFALFLKAYYPEKTKEIKNSLRDVIKEFDKGDQYIDYSRNYDKENFQKTFSADLSEDNNTITLDYLTEVVVSASDKGLLNTQYTEIYCGIAKKIPEIIYATSPYYGSNRDNFIPRLKCDFDVDYQKFPLKTFNQYVNLTEKADGHFLSLHQGSIRYSYYAKQNLMLNQTYLGLLSQEQTQYNIKYPYEVWSYLSLENRKIFLQIKQEYLKTKKILITYLVNTRKFSESKALHLTEYLLFNYPFGTRYLYRTPKSYKEKIYDTIPQTLRSLMIEEKNINEIEKFALSADFLQKQQNQLPQDYYFGKSIGSATLIHIAVQKPEYLDFLFKLTKNMSEEQQQTYDMVANVNARNNINKTPLMVAAQFNYFESAKILINAGADVNAITKSDDYNDLLHDNRTALMYAAENADLDFIKLLLDNGANKNMTDTRGYRAVDYLMGFSYGNYNQNLSDEEFKQALQLLL